MYSELHKNKICFIQTENCKCNGWKNPNPPPTPPRVDVSQPLANLTDPCRSCNHTLSKPDLLPTHITFIYLKRNFFGLLVFVRLRPR